MGVAAVIMLKETELDEPGRMDFVGTDCDSVEEALGTLREALVHMKRQGQAWRMAMIVPEHTVEQVSMWGLEVEEVQQRDS
jgi:hypothetical protein